MFRMALRYAFEEQRAAVQITEVATRGALETAVIGNDFDLALVDLLIPGAIGFSSLVYLRCERPELPVIVVSSNEDPRTIRRAQQFGAAAFVPKSVPPETLNRAIDTVLAGGQWFPAQKAERDEADAQLAHRLASLTPQQLRVLLRLATGLLNKQIAAELSLSENTVKIHVSAILKKLGCYSRTQAAVLIKSTALEGATVSDDDSEQPF